MTYQEAVNAWVADRIGTPVHDAFVTGIEPGGTCGEGTCWFDDDITISYADESGAALSKRFCISPGEFVEQVAKIAGRS